MTNPADDLTTIYRLLDEGRHPAWPERIQQRPAVGGTMPERYLLSYTSPVTLRTDRIFLSYDDALDLVTAECERWLSKQHYGQYQREGLGDNVEYSLRGIEFDTLTEALTHALENTKEK